MKSLPYSQRPSFLVAAASIGLALAACSSPESAHVAPAPAADLEAARAVVTKIAGNATLGESFDAGGGITGHVLQLSEFDIHILYTSADGSRILNGGMADSEGRDLHGQWMAQYTPEVDITERYASLADNAGGSLTTGKVPSTLRVVYDPHCGYCKSLYSQLANSDVEIHWHPVGIVTPQSPVIAAAMLSADMKPADVMAMVQDQAGAARVVEGAPPSEAAAAAIGKNLAAAESMGLSGVPGLVWIDPTGRARSSRGMPAPEELQRIVEAAKIRS